MNTGGFDDQLLQAALDGELDARGTLEFERARAADPALAAEYERLAALRGALRNRAENLRAPESLREKIAAMAMAGNESAPAVPQSPPRSNVLGFGARPRMALAASVLCAAALGGVATSVISRQATRQGPDRIAMLLVDDHRRALLAASPIDVESSDRHTVKPWFDARLALSPNVVDLSAKGVTLVGGRAEVVDGAPAPAMVYREREHLISVTALPAARFDALASTESVNGYNAIAWRDGAFAYWAVSDLPRADLETFVADFKTAEAAGEASR